VRQPPEHAVANGPFAATPPTPAAGVVGADDPAGQHRPASLKPLTDDFEAELVNAGESGQVRTGQDRTGQDR
jgi:hypothetical protein